MKEIWIADNAAELLRERATWDSYHHLSDTEWVLVSCADCDPTLDDEQDEQYDGRPFSIIIPKGSHAPNNCPRCGSYLGMTNDGTPEVYVTTAKIHEAK